MKYKLKIYSVKLKSIKESIKSQKISLKLNSQKLKRKINSYKMLLLTKLENKKYKINIISFKRQEDSSILLLKKKYKLKSKQNLLNTKNYDFLINVLSIFMDEQL